MQREESLYPGDWLRLAEKDLKRVSGLLGMEDAEAAGFFLQQAAEKYLKALLLSKGWQLQRIHDLEALLNAALPHEPSLEEYRPVLQKVTSFYFVDRYPLMVESGLTSQDVIEALERVDQLAGVIGRLIQS